MGSIRMRVIAVAAEDDAHAELLVMMDAEASVPSLAAETIEASIKRVAVLIVG